MKKMTEYIVAGVKANDEKVFIQRVGELLEKKGLLEFLTDGVPTMIRIVDKDELIAAIQSKNKDRRVQEIKEVSINSDFRIVVNYKYARTYWYRTQEEADKHYYENRSSKNEDYPIEGEDFGSTSEYMVIIRKDSSCVQNQDGLEVYFV
jgi:hypothetical protein